MVRTRAEATVKVAAAKAPRKVFTSSSAGGSSSSSSSTTPSKGSKYGGGNPYKPQPVPEWQKGIGSFFKLQEDQQRGDEEVMGQSSCREGSRVCEVEQGEGSGLGDVEQGEGSEVRNIEDGEGSGMMESPSPSTPPKNGIISDDDDD